MIRSLKISGFRSLQDAQLELRPLNVLIGPNQSGKTNFLDALDLLKQAGVGRLRSAISLSRGGFANIYRAGPDYPHIQFEVELSVIGPRVRFEAIQFGFSLFPSTTTSYFIGHQHVGANHKPYFETGEGGSLSWDQASGQPAPIDLSDIDQHELVLSSYLGFSTDRLFRTIRTGLDSIKIYPGFETRPRWAGERPGDAPQMRQPQFVTNATILDPSGDNFVNVLYTLSQDEDRWDDFKANIRTGFPDFDNIAFPADAGQGRIALAWLDRRFPRKKFPAEVLSAGTLCFLAYAAAMAAPEAPTLIAIDEPEQHLHPKLLYRLVGLMEQASAKHQIIVTTHSDALLSYLSDPASVVLVNNGPEGTTFTRPPEADLAAWLKKYNLGQLRESGHLAAFAPPEV